MPQISLADAKIKALELVNCAPGVPRNMLFDTLTALYVDYFTSAQAYKELEGSNLIHIEAGHDKDLVDGSDDLLYITPLGEAMLDELIKTLDAPSQAELKRIGKNLYSSVQNKALILANYEVILTETNPEQELFLVHLSRKLPDSGASIELKFTVSDKDTADKLCTRWHNDDDLSLYKKLLKDLGC